MLPDGSNNASDLFALPDSGAGEAISLESLSHASTSSGDLTPVDAHRTSGEDLVSEPAHEVEEG